HVTGVQTCALPICTVLQVIPFGLICCYIKQLIKPYVLLERVIFRCNDLLSHTVVERKGNVPFLRKKLTKAKVCYNVILLYILPASFIWALFNGTKTNSAHSSCCRYSSKVGKVSIHVSYSSHTAFIIH